MHVGVECLDLGHSDFLFWSVMLANDDTPMCSAKEHEQLLYMVKAGMVFEVQEWIAEGKPTLRPGSSSKLSSALCKSVTSGNHSMVRVLWESAWQDLDEQKYALVEALERSNSPGREIVRYLLKNGCPLSRWVNGCDLCMSHDEDLIRLGVSRGIKIVGPEGFADALGKAGSKWLIGFYKRSVTDYPGLHVEGAKALYYAIGNSKIRLIALLRWAGVDPFYKFSEEVCLEELDLGYSYEVMPIRNLSRSRKTSEVLEILKLKPTVVQWFGLLEDACTVTPNEVKTILSLMPNHQGVFRMHSDEAGKILRSIIRWWSYDLHSTDTKKDLKWYAYCLISMGVQALHIDDEEIKHLRCQLYDIKDPDTIVHMLWYMYEMADDRSRELMHELVRTGKMQNMVKQYYPWLVYDLGFLDTRGKRVVLDGEKRWELEKFELPEQWRNFTDEPKQKRAYKRKATKPKLRDS